MIVFSRGAFQRDISSIGRGEFLIAIRGEWLRRFMRVGVPDAWLEQVVSLSLKSELRAAFPLAIQVFAYLANRTRSRIVFGGVDYFEVALFANRELYCSHVTIESVFHENYAIDYVQSVNLALYQTISNRFLFDRLYTYGPPATRILADYTLDEKGPTPMVMPRLAGMESDEDFSRRLASVDRSDFGSTILLLAFPGSEYLAPICFTTTLIEFARLGREEGLRPLVKFKNPRTAKFFIKKLAPLDHHIHWISDGSVEELVWQAGFTIVFNSISLYEALLGPTIVIIPSFLDAMHDDNLLQETQESVRQLCGNLKSVRFAADVSDIHEIVKKMSQEDTVSIAIMEREARKALVRRKFYLGTI